MQPEQLKLDSPFFKELSDIWAEQIDKGVRILAGTDGETVTQGIDGLARDHRRTFRDGSPVPL